MLWVLKRLRRRLPAIAVVTAADVGNAVLSVMFALGTRRVIDSAVGGSREEFLQDCVWQGCIIVGILALLTLSRSLRSKLSAQLDRDWKQDILHGLLHGEYAKVKAYHSGELLNRLNNDVRVVDEGILSTIPSVAAMIMRLVTAVVVLVALEPWLSLAVVAAGVAVVLGTGFVRRHLKGLHKRVSEEEGRVSGFIQETLEKLLMVQALDVSDEMERRADELLGRRFEIQETRRKVSLAANTGVSVVYYGASFVSLVWCAVGLLNGSMSFGSLTAVTQLVNQIQGPFVNLSAVIPQYVAMIAAAERLMELEDVYGQCSPGQEPGELYEGMTALGAEHLSFAYDRDQVLHDASFRLPKGAFAVITGTSGIGKSTLLKLMLGVFEPDGGELYLEGDQGRVRLDRTTRRLFAYVPQGNLLLSGTLRENLTITRPRATEEEIRQAVYVSAMDEFLTQLPNGLETMLGENGAGLSEGQAQRLAIARAVLSGSPVLLLDECTSALDARTEETVLQRLRTLPGRSCIAVTHRPAAVELCDWRIEMADGQVKLDRLKGTSKNSPFAS